MAISATPQPARLIRQWIMALVLPGLFAVLLISNLAAPVSDDEAYLFNAIHVTGQPPDGLKAQARAAFDRLAGAWQQADAGVHTRLAALVLAGWAVVVGDSLWVMRLLPMMGWLLIAALGMRLARRWAGFRAVLSVPLAVALVYALLRLSADVTLPLTVQQVIAERDPLHPVVYALPNHKPVGYYNRMWGLTEGLAINIGWMPQASPESYITLLHQAESVWLMLPEGSLTPALAAQLQAEERQMGYEARAGGIVFARFDRATKR